ncbi:hypothetical protein N803_00390 [Knoellia subterranea KCTC 19937]|uniref:Uncharacterized protein n=1 Tax=Knoellia subterranea KCTC 19937 TaxID=1385521 RepID=A0A0A0JS87_9MICO|nr:hypothetical protein N803_00390 [Knoellia subterranea KCTC 19937]
MCGDTGSSHVEPSVTQIAQERASAHVVDVEPFVA